MGCFPWQIKWKISTLKLRNHFGFIQTGFFSFWKQSSGGMHWGILTCQRYTGMCRFDDPPFLGSSAAPETHLFTPSVSSYALQFPFFEKFCIFRPISLRFWQNCSSKHTIFWQKFVTKTLVFKEKKFVL